MVSRVFKRGVEMSTRCTPRHSVALSFTYPLRRVTVTSTPRAAMRGNNSSQCVSMPPKMSGMPLVPVTTTFIYLPITYQLSNAGFRFHVSSSKFHVSWQPSCWFQVPCSMFKVQCSKFRSSLHSVPSVSSVSSVLSKKDYNP